MALEPCRYLWNLKCFHYVACVYYEGKEIMRNSNTNDQATL